MKTFFKLFSMHTAPGDVCKFYTLFVLLVCFGHLVSAQDNPKTPDKVQPDSLTNNHPEQDNLEQVHSCSQNLIDAEDAYSKGQIEKVSDLISSCLKDGFSRDQKTRALRLLTLCHLYYNLDSAAVSSMLRMLKNSPEYKINRELDPAEFVTLYKTFRNVPVFILGVKAGGGLTNIYKIKNFNDLNSSGNNGKYDLNMSYYAGLSVETPVYKKWSAVYEIYYQSFQTSFHNNPLSYTTIDVKETRTAIDIPLLVQYNLLKKKVVPYVNAGVSLSLLLSANANFTRNDKELEQVRGPFIYEADMKPQRNTFNYAMAVGAGVRIKDVILNGYITLDVRYNRYFRDQAKSDKRADDPKITYDFLYTDNAFKIENFSILAGFKLPIYIPKQKRWARLKPANRSNNKETKWKQ